ncbi:MAG: NYN domain-containing protein [Nitrospirae bacterium]|nr:NYN domain-containing protein [Nitrospirota bacterium]
MAIRIIVDGYNFIGAQKGLRGDIEVQRERLIDRLARYRSVKGYAMTVVFDGWRSGWPDEHGELRRGLEVVFSRHGEKADQVIVRMAEALGSASLIVSSDRDVARQVRAAGGTAVSIGEFEARVTQALDAAPDASEPAEGGRPAARTEKKGNPRRLSKQERKKRLRLNKL